MSDQFPSRSEVLAKHLRYHDRPDRGEWRVFCSCESRKWFTEAIEVISDETYIAHVERRWREACTATTVEQLDALPDGCVVRDQRGLLWETDQGHMYAASFAMPMCIKTVALPAVIVWHPEWEESR